MRTKEHHIIAREGYPIIAVALLLVVGGWFIHPYVAAVLSLGLIFCLYFFRNPTRDVPMDSSLVIAPADGKIIRVGEVDENRFLNQKVKKVSIFMSPFNVHVNRIPVEGTIKKVAYNKGKYFPAFSEKASLENEQNAIVIENKKGENILFVQIAGWLARRIVCHAKPGESLKQGSIFGLIRFGSRVDVYLPLDYSIIVEVGQKVKGGESILAKTTS